MTKYRDAMRRANGPVSAAERRTPQRGARRAQARFAPGVVLLEDRTLLAFQTVTSISASVRSAGVGQPITLTARVIDALRDTAAPTGSVTFFNGATNLGTQQLVAGIAQLTTSALPAGVDQVTASYGGGGGYLPSMSGTIATPPPLDLGSLGPSAVAVAPDGTIFAAGHSSVLQVDVANGTRSRLTGTGVPGFGGDGGPAAGGRLNDAIDVAVDTAGNVYIADRGNQRIREVVKANGNIITIAGNGTAGYSGDGGPATSASLNNPSGIAVDAAGNLFIADTSNNRIRKVDAGTGTITTVAGTGLTDPAFFTVDSAVGGMPATRFPITGPNGVAVDAAGNLFIADSGNNRIREVIAATGNIITVAGKAGAPGFSGDGGPAIDALFNAPLRIAVDPAGNLFITDFLNHRIREVVAATGNVITVAGNGDNSLVGTFGDGGPATSAILSSPLGIAVGRSGELFIVDTGHSLVRMATVVAVTVPVFTATPVSTTTTVTTSVNPASLGRELTFTATVSAGSPAPTVPAGSVQFQIDGTSFGAPVPMVRGVATSGLASSLSLGNHVVTAVYASSDPGFAGSTGTLAGGQTITTVMTATAVAVTPAAGPGQPVVMSATVIPQYHTPGLPTGNVQFQVDGASFGAPVPLAGGKASLSTSALSGGVHTITASYLGSASFAPSSTGSIMSVAGRSHTGFTTTGSSGDSGPALDAFLSAPYGAFVDAAGNLYIADSGNDRVRGVIAGTDRIINIVGYGFPNHPDENVPANAAGINFPKGVVFDAAGNLFYSDTANHRIRELVKATGTVITIVGGDAGGYSGDNGPASAAKINAADGLAIDAAGNLYFSDSTAHVVRKIIKATGIVVTIAGSGTAGNSGDGGPATAARLDQPRGIAVDAAGNVYIVDAIAGASPGRIRRVDAATGVITTIAGKGNPVTGIGDGEPALNAIISSPDGLAIDALGNLYFTETLNGRVREIVAATGTITTIAGLGIQGFSGDGGPATQALLAGPRGITVDQAGILYVGDAGNHRIRLITAPAAVSYTPAVATTIAVTAAANPSVYGQAVTFTATVSSASGTPAGSVQFKVDGVDFGAPVTLVAGAATSPSISTLGAGTHAITANFFSSDPAFTNSSGTLAGGQVVDKASLTVTADGKSKPYGGALPALTASYSGFVNGDTAASLDTPPTLATTATAASDVGSYPITATGATDANYTITFVPGTLTVNATPLAVTADNKTRVYGQANPPFTASYGGFVLGQDASALGGTLSFTTAATAASHVGAYTITPGGLTSVNYAITFVSGTLNVTPAPLTITAESKTSTYGAALPALTASFAGFVNGDTPASLATQPALATGATAASAVGTYPITASGAVAADYAISYANGTLAVIPAPLVVTANDASRPAGQPNPAFTASFSGFVLGQGPAVLGGGLAFSTTADAASPPGTYPIVPSGLASGNYAISYANGTLTVTPASAKAGSSAIVTPSAPGSTYGQALTFTAVVTATAAGQPTPTGTLQFIVDGSPLGAPVTLAGGTAASPSIANLGAGGHTIVANYSGDAAFVASTSAPLPITVAKAPLTVTAANTSRTYGQPNPTFTASYAGFVPGQGPADLGGTLSFATAAGNASHAGSYPVTPGGLTSGNYAITFAPGTLTVTPSALTITADDKSKLYGAAIPALTASYSGFVNGDTAASLDTPPTLATTATAASDVGSYPITATGAADADYTITYGPGTLTVNLAPLTVTADNKARVYGQANPAFTASVAGFVLGQGPAVLGGTLSFATSASAASHVGTYPVTPGGLTSTNYAITFAPGTLDVTKAPLTITADNKTSTYGAALPALTAGFTGFVNGDTAAGLTTQPTLTTTANAGSNAGAYPITASGAAAADYSISYAPGTLTMSAAPLAITADNTTRVYGQPNPPFSAGFAGFVLGQDPAVLGGTLSFTTAADIRSHVGSYAVTPGGLTSSNYAITFVPGTLDVTPAPLTITAENKATVYGAVLPVLTASFTGFVDGDTPASLDTPAALATTATAASDVGSYPITVSGAADPDYAINQVAGTLTVDAAPLTVSADNAVKVYGQANPPLTASFAGFVLGQGPAALGGTLSFTTAAGVASHVGSYSVTPGGLTSSNYAITFAPGTLRITPAPLSIAADNKTAIRGTAPPALTARFAGFVNGDTPASLDTPPSLATSATASSPAGAYPITVSGAADGDYAITAIAGTLTIRPAVQGDYDGDGKADLALFYRQPRSSQGVWFVPNVTTGAGLKFGSSTRDVPVQVDFNGDGRTDFAVYRPSTAQWLIGGQPTIKYGKAKVDIPVPGYYDGLTTTQLATYRPTTGQWFIAGRAQPVTLGGRPGDIPVPADYDGDGRTDVAIYRPGTGQWFIGVGTAPVRFGGSKDIPVPGDYDGVGHAQLALFRPSTHQWFVAGSPALGKVTFGGSGDVPVPGDYDGVGRTQIAMYRPRTGEWLIGGHATAIRLGGPHFVPAAAPYAYRTVGGPLSIMSVARPTAIAQRQGPGSTKPRFVP